MTNIIAYVIVAALCLLCIAVGLDLMATHRMLGAIAIAAGAYVLVEGSWVFYKCLQPENTHG